MISPTQRNNNLNPRKSERDVLDGVFSETTMPPVPDAIVTESDSAVYENNSGFSESEGRKTAIGRKVEELGTKLRDRAEEGGRLGAAAGSVADGIERTGSYIREHDLRTVGDDLKEMVRKHPLPATLLGLGLGFLLGRLGKKGG